MIMIYIHIKIHLFFQGLGLTLIKCNRHKPITFYTLYIVTNLIEILQLSDL